MRLRGKKKTRRGDILHETWNVRVRQKQKVKKREREIKDKPFYGQGGPTKNEKKEERERKKKQKNKLNKRLALGYQIYSQGNPKPAGFPTEEEMGSRHREAWLHDEENRGSDYLISNMLVISPKCTEGERPTFAKSICISFISIRLPILINPSSVFSFDFLSTGLLVYQNK